MLKRFTVYSIPDEVSGDDFWEYHTKVHGKDVWKATSQFKTKYVLNRVKKTLYGKTDVFCFIESNWPSEEAAQKDQEAITTIRVENGKTIAEDFMSRVKAVYSVLVEEHDVIKSVTGKPSAVSGDGSGVKRFTVYAIPEGINHDDIWEYHKNKHSADVFKATSHLNKTQYLLNRVKKVISGNTDVFCLIETKWASEESVPKDGAILQSTILDNGKNIAEDFLSQVKDCYSVLVEEYDVIKSKAGTVG